MPHKSDRRYAKAGGRTSRIVDNGTERTGRRFGASSFCLSRAQQFPAVYCGKDALTLWYNNGEHGLNRCEVLATLDYVERQTEEHCALVLLRVPLRVFGQRLRKD